MERFFLCFLSSLVLVLFVLSGILHSCAIRGMVFHLLSLLGFYIRVFGVIVKDILGHSN